MNNDFNSESDNEAKVLRISHTENLIKKLEKWQKHLKIMKKHFNETVFTFLNEESLKEKNEMT